MQWSAIVAFLSLLASYFPWPTSRYRKFFDLSPQPAIICSREGVFISVNQAFCDKLGYTRSELVGKKFMRFVANEDIEETKRKLDELRDGANVMFYSNVYISKRGDLVYFTWVAWSPEKSIYAMVVR